MDVCVCSNQELILSKKLLWMKICLAIYHWSGGILFEMFWEDFYFDHIKYYFSKIGINSKFQALQLFLMAHRYMSISNLAC